MKPTAYNDHIATPPLDYAKIDVNTVKFNEGKDKYDRIGASQIGGVKIMGRLCLRQLNNLRLIQELDPNNLPGFATYIGSLAKTMDCTRKTVQNRLRHYEKCGAIIRRENNGKNGIRIWFHPDILFKDQDGYGHFTGSEKTYSASHTEPPRIYTNNTSTTGSTGIDPKKPFIIGENLLQKNDSPEFIENLKKVKFTPFSSRTTGTVNTNTTSVNKLITAESKQLEGVPPEQNVLPVPSAGGKGEDTGTPTGTRESRPKKIESKGKSRQIRTPENAVSEPPISKKDGIGGAGRAFLLARVQAFWEYATKKIYPGVILLECEEKRILNYIWASVFLKFPAGHSEDDWWSFYRRTCKRVDKVADWLDLNPAFELPDPQWYFDPRNTRGVRFALTEQWLQDDERKNLINKIKWEVNEYAKGKGRYRNRTPLELFRRHERMVSVRNDHQLSEMFRGLRGTLYGKLKIKEKF